MQLQPGNLNVHLSLVEARLRDGDLQGAYDHLDRLVRQHPDNEELRLSLVYLLVGVDELDAAVEILGGGLDHNPGAELYRELGALLGRLGRHEDAANAFRMLRHVDPTDHFARAQIEIQELLAEHSI